MDGQCNIVRSLGPKLLPIGVGQDGFPHDEKKLLKQGLQTLA